MRISDWSSDVCSSDLTRALDPRFGKNRRPFGGAIRSGDRERAVAPHDLVPAHRPCQQREGGVRDTVAVEIVDQPATRGLGVHEAQEGDKLRVRHMVRDEARDRSEEHTSELQSLMRISYAVFCLKKTN